MYTLNNPTDSPSNDPTPNPSKSPTDTVCCDVNDRGQDRTEACCPDGTWVESIDNGRTFNCGGVFIVSGSSNALFGSICLTPFPTLPTSPTASPTSPTTAGPTVPNPTWRNINAISPSLVFLNLHFT